LIEDHGTPFGDGVGLAIVVLLISFGPQLVEPPVFGDQRDNGIFRR
jgi:hypothetical protein